MIIGYTARLVIEPDDIFIYKEKMFIDERPVPGTEALVEKLIDYFCKLVLVEVMDIKLDGGSKDEALVQADLKIGFYHLGETINSVTRSVRIRLNVGYNEFSRMPVADAKKLVLKYIGKPYKASIVEFNFFTR